MDQAELHSLRRLLDNRGWQLRFPQALEREFQTDYAARYYRHMQLAMMLGIFGLMSCGVLDWWWMPEVATQMWTARLALGLPMLGILAFSQTETGRTHLQLLTLLGTSLGAAMIVICSTIAPEPFPHYFRCSLSLVILIAFVLSRLQFTWGIASAVVIMLELNIGLLYTDTSDIVLLVAPNFVVAAAAGFALVGSFLIERGLRQNYLQSRLLAFENHGLEEANLRLQYLTAIDGLTQLANRRSLDMTLSTEWQRAQRKGEPLALLMIDVDHFKLFNDHYGHQAGDECLREVGGALKDFARRPGDLAARYGGEEFALVLSGANAHQANQVAEKVRDKIHHLAIPHQHSSHGTVTASIGVASVVPETGKGPEALILAADKALYRAKHGGRNRVMLSENAEDSAATHEPA